MGNEGSPHLYSKRAEWPFVDRTILSMEATGAVATGAGGAVKEVVVAVAAEALGNGATAVAAVAVGSSACPTYPIAARYRIDMMVKVVVEVMVVVNTVVVAMV